MSSITSAPQKGEKGDKGDKGDAGAAGTITSINTAVRSINTNFTISSARPAFASYSITVQATNPLLAGIASATATLQYSTTGGSSWATAGTISVTLSVGLAVSVAITNAITGTLSGYIPSGALVRIVSSVNGSAAVSFVTGQETIL